MCYNPKGYPYEGPVIQVAFTDEKLARTCSSDHAGKRRYGQDWPLIRRRLKELEAAPSLDDMQLGNPHPLTGQLAGAWAVSTSRNDRIVFEVDHDPLPLLGDGGVDRKRVTAIAITEVRHDYH
jgi:proteic killer suppression protein